MGAESKLSAEAAARFVLGLSQGCSKEDVKRAFRRLALVFHPDKNKGQNEEEATKRFQAIATAKDLLLKTSSAAGHLQTNSAHGRRPTTPTPAKKPVYVAIWMCGACQMRHLGSSPGSGRNSDVACARASSSTLCFCGHRFGAHELVEGAGALKFRCRQQGCACGNFSYVPPGALCTCGHGPGSHDAKPFHSCQVSGCLCQTFHHAGVCSCRHSWACHRTEIQKLGPSPYAGNPGNPAAAKTTFCPWRRPCDERSECSDDCGATTRGNASSRPEGKAEPARSTSTVPPARSSAPSPTPASAAAPAAPAPRGRGVSAPSTPTGRSRSSSATGDAFFMPKFENLGQNAGPSGDSRNYVQSGQRLDVRGKPIGRCPSVPTPARGATPTPASPASPSAAPRAARRSTSQTPRASSPAEADTATSADKAVRARPRPSSAPPVRTDQAAMRPEPTGPTEPTGPPCATRPPRPRPSSAGAKGSSSGRGPATAATAAEPGTPPTAEAKEKVAEKRHHWEDPSAEPDAEPDTEAESQGDSSAKGHEAKKAKTQRSEAPVWSKRSTCFSVGNPHGCASKVAAAAVAAAAAKAAGTPWWVRLHQKMPKESEETRDRSDGPPSEASAETTETTDPGCPPPVSQDADPPRTASPVPRTAPVKRQRPPPPAPSPRQTLPRRPPVPRAPRAERVQRPSSAPPKRTPVDVDPTVGPAPAVGPAAAWSERNCWQTTQERARARQWAKHLGVSEASHDSQEQAPPEPAAAAPAAPAPTIPQWPWVSPRFFGADSDDEGSSAPGAPASVRSQSQQTLRRLMELQRTLQTPFLLRC